MIKIKPTTWEKYCMKHPKWCETYCDTDNNIRRTILNIPVSIICDNQELSMKQFRRNSRSRCAVCRNCYIENGEYDDILKCSKRDLVNNDYKNGYSRCQQYQYDEFLDKLMSLDMSIPDDIYEHENIRKINLLICDIEKLYKECYRQ